jgi:hypothetical protein
MGERNIYKWKYSGKRGWGFMCWECGWGLIDGRPVIPLWLLRLGHSLWYFCDCWTLCFGLSCFLLRKDWLTTTSHTFQCVAFTILYKVVQALLPRHSKYVLFPTGWELSQRIMKGLDPLVIDEFIVKMLCATKYSTCNYFLWDFSIPHLHSSF